jgi:branched-subunit amino acid transport protein AzlD
MNPEILMLALAVGAANWLFRYGPMRLDLGARAGTGPLARFLSATGPAAIATLVVASVLPMVAGAGAQVLPLLAGTATVLALWFWRRSVVIATLGGPVAYGLVVWLAG